MKDRLGFKLLSTPEILLPKEFNFSAILIPMPPKPTINTFLPSNSVGLNFSYHIYKDLWLNIKVEQYIMFRYIGSLYCFSTSKFKIIYF